MTEKSSYSEIIAEISPKGEKWEKLNFEGKQKIDILNFLYVFPYIGFCMPKQKKIEKNCAADGVFGPAVNWAEMAAAHENR